MATREKRYEGKVVIITGGSSGIGKGCAKVFAQNGSKVVICDIDEKEGQKVEAECAENGPGEVFFMKCDVTDEESIRNTVEVTSNKYGRIDCLINNVGIHPLPETIDETSSADFRNLFNVNVVSCFLMAKYCLPHIRKCQGSIINIASMVAQIGQPKALSYVATKGAIFSMTKAMAIDEAQYGVRVNSISPGNILTPLWEKFLADRPDKESVLKESAEWQLNGRFGTTEECALACLFLATDATFCTGININMSGGAELTYGKKTQMNG